MKKPDRISEQLRRALEQPAADVTMEAALAQAGILKELEEAGIIPIVENPNPYDVNTQLNDYDRWWRENPDAGRTFRRDCDQRQQALKQLHIGICLSKS